jgi:hypothetical protein
VVMVPPTASGSQRKDCQGEQEDESSRQRHGRASGEGAARSDILLRWRGQAWSLPVFRSSGVLSRREVPAWFTRRWPSDPKQQRNAYVPKVNRHAIQAVNDATDRVVKEGGVIHEDAIPSQAVWPFRWSLLAD